MAVHKETLVAAAGLTIGVLRLVVLTAPLEAAQVASDSGQVVSAAQLPAVEPSQYRRKAGKRLEDLSPEARDLAVTCTAWMDGFWDDSAGLCWGPYDVSYAKCHAVRETAWYAIGLLLRNNKVDDERAQLAIAGVLDRQCTDPESQSYGAFLRYPESPLFDPGEGWVWAIYDDYWCQFIGSTLALILREYEERLPSGLVKRMEQAICHAACGAQRPFGVPDPGTTNIFLMHAFLLDYAGSRLKEPEWTRRAGELAEQVYDLFKENKAFPEFNAPTYYGVDLYALALWRVWGSSPRFRQLGAEMEADLWRDIARFYHAGLRNLAGPFTRAYGMEMTHYVSLTGLWMWEAIGRDLAPVPVPHPLELRTLQEEFMWGPCFALLGTQIPADALPHLKGFQGERQVERVISRSPRLVATAWMGADVILGALESSSQRWARWDCRLMTVHWRLPKGAIGWICLWRGGPVDARAEKGIIRLTCPGDATFRISVSGTIGRDLWTLPGLVVEVETDARSWETKASQTFTDVTYRGATMFTIRTHTGP